MKRKIETGEYVAFDLVNNAIIQLDCYNIFEERDSLIIESEMSIFGINGFYQCGKFILDKEWNPKQLDIHIDTMNIKATYNFVDNKVQIKQGTKDNIENAMIQIINEDFFVSINGAISFSLIWTRKFDFDDSSKKNFQIIPAGFAEIKVVKDINHEGIPCKQLNLNALIAKNSNSVNILCDKNGKVINYKPIDNSYCINLK